jgi:hypothetical protein
LLVEEPKNLRSQLRKPKPEFKQKQTDKEDRQTTQITNVYPDFVEY